MRNKEILTRCRLACRLPTFQALGEAIGVKKQIISAAAKLKNPPQTIICKTAELTGVSYDWLLSGKNTSGSVPHLNDLSRMSRVGLDHEWVERTIGVSIADLRFLDVNGGNTIYIINVTARLRSSGKYVFELNGSPSVHDCRVRVDGSVFIDGEDCPGNVPEPIGKVIAVFAIC